MEGVTAGVPPTAAAALDLLLRVCGGSSHTAEMCECLCSDRTDVVHDVSLMYDALYVPLVLMLYMCVCVGVNSVCLLADDCCGDHRECQRRCEEV